MFLSFDLLTGSGAVIADLYRDGDMIGSHTLTDGATSVSDTGGFDEVVLSTIGDTAFRLAEIEFLREDLIA